MLRKPLTREGKDGDCWEGGIAKEGVGTLKRQWLRRLGTRRSRGRVEKDRRRCGEQEGCWVREKGMDGASLVRTLGGLPVEEDAQGGTCRRQGGGPGSVLSA